MSQKYLAQITTYRPSGRRATRGGILVMLFAAPFDPRAQFLLCSLLPLFDPRVWEPEGEGQAEPESPFLTLSYKFAASATYSLI